MRRALGLCLLVIAGGACRCDDPARTRRAGPAIEVDPSAPAVGADHVLDFGGVRIGALKVLFVTVKSAGTSPLKFTAEVDAETSHDFLVRAPREQVTLLPSEESKIEVRYVPSEAAADEGTLTLLTDDPENERVVVKIVGHGVTSAIRVCRVLLAGGEQCHDEVAPERLVLDIGEVTAGASATRDLVIHSVGDGDLRVGRVVVLPGGSAEWSVDVPTDDGGGFDVAAGASKTVPVTFSAFDGGAEAAELEILSDSPDEPRIVVDLRALGKGPRLCVEPSLSVDFGEVAVGQKSLKHVDLVSCGTEPIEVKTAAIPQPSEFGFEIAPGVPVTLQPSDRLTLRMQYQPADAGEDFARAFISSSDPGTPRGFINLRGAGTLCDLSATPDPTDFGQVPVGVKASKQVLLRNRGNSDCTVSALGAPTDAAFALENPPPTPFTLSAGGQKPVTVSFAPTTPTSRSATFRVSSNDGAVPDRDVQLRGQGTQPPPCALEASPSALVFPDTAVGGTRSSPVILTNRGTDDCFLASASMRSGSSPAFTAQLSGGGFGFQSIGPGQTATVNVTFAPQTAGNHQGEIEIKYDEQNPLFPSLTMYVPVSGTVPEPRICVSPMTITFSGVPPNSTAQQTLRITSCGAGPLTVRRIGMAPGTSRDFTLSAPPGLPLVLAAGASQNVTVAYRPTNSNPDFGAIEITSNDPTQPLVRVALRGNAIDPPCARELSCAPDALEFPDTEVGRTAALSITCISTGAQGVTALAAARGPGTSSEFQPVPSSNINRTLAPGQSLRVEVLYTPTSAGGDAGSIEITSDGCVARAVVQITGIGKTPTFPPCPPPQTFSPQVKWEWKGGSLSNSRNVGMTPVVVNLTDDNQDGLVDENDKPDVVFSSCTQAECCVGCNPGQTPSIADGDYSGKGTLRAVSGATGAEIWNSDPALRVTAAAQVAAADLDGDNQPEIIAVKHAFRPGQDCPPPVPAGFPICGKYSIGTLYAFDRHGKIFWESEPWKQPDLLAEHGSAPLLADLDQDGFPEVIYGQTVFDRNGIKKWETDGDCGQDGHGCFPVATDLDDNGTLEVIFGRSVYNADGTKRWTAPIANDAFAIVVDVDSDGVSPEVIYRTALQEITVVNANGSLRRKIALPGQPPEDGACPAPIAAADLDGDGSAELIVPAGNFIHGVRGDGTVLWTQPIDDYSGQCGASGAAAFDFEGDGKYEAVYHDTSHVYVFRGTTGEVIYTADRTSVTLFETPVIADVDNDNHADVLFTNIGNLFPPSAGVVALSNSGNTWPATRRVWLQHSYHVTDANENGTIPRRETPHWKLDNSVRANPPLCR